jgi:hypothetical protein
VVLRLEAWGPFLFVNADAAPPPLADALGGLAPAVESVQRGVRAGLVEHGRLLPDSERLIAGFQRKGGRSAHVVPPRVVRECYGPGAQAKPDG